MLAGQLERDYCSDRQVRLAQWVQEIVQGESGGVAHSQSGCADRNRLNESQCSCTTRTHKSCISICGGTCSCLRSLNPHRRRLPGETRAQIQTNTQLSSRSFWAKRERELSPTHPAAPRRASHGQTCAVKLRNSAARRITMRNGSPTFHLGLIVGDNLFVLLDFGLR